MTATNPVSMIALEADPLTIAAIRTAAAEGQIAIAGIERDFDGLLRSVGERHPGVVLLDLGQAGADPVAVVRSVLGISPDSCIIVTGADVTPALISRAVSAGARGFLLRPFAPEELAATIHDAHGSLTELRRLQRGAVPIAKPRGAIIAVYSPKGGVGCTTIATSLSVALAHRSKRPVAIVDLDLQFGDVGVALDLRSANSIIDLVTNEAEIDGALIDDVFVRHESGIRALVSPEHLGTAESVDTDRIVQTLEALRDHFDFIVCDLWSSLDDLTLGVLRVADHILLVTTPELPSLKNIRRVIAATPIFGDERTRIVLNRHPGKAGVSIADVERNLGRRVTSTIPSEGIGVTDAINQGISMFDSRARVRASRSYTRLADALLHDDGHRAIQEIAAPARA